MTLRTGAYLGPFEIVRRDLTGLLGGFHRLASIAPDVANRDSAVLGHRLHDLDVLAPTFFNQLHIAVAAFTWQQKQWQHTIQQPL